MKKNLCLIFLYSVNTFAMLSYGTGTEDCTWNVTDTKNQRVFNCSSVTIGAGATISFNANDYIVIQSRGDVLIDGDINLNATGSAGGPGGGNGGVCPTSTGACNAVNGENKNAGQGSGGAQGLAGGAGGGGSGASFGAATATNGANGANGGGTGGAGGVANNITYFPESGFTSNFTGGAGGGAGGSGIDGGSVIEPGGAGGGGGGGIIIIAMGTITINGNITANGANGGAGSSANVGQAGGGGGGSGSGGAIYIIGKNNVNLIGSLSAQAGTLGGTGSGLIDFGGNGGIGSTGRIRVDTPTGVYAGGGSSNPVAVQNTLPTIYDPLLDGQNFNSDIEYACSYRELEVKNFWISLLIGFFTVLSILGISKGLHRLRYYSY